SSGRRPRKITGETPRGLVASGGEANRFLQLCCTLPCGCLASGAAKAHKPACASRAGWGPGDFSRCAPRCGRRALPRLQPQPPHALLAPPEVMGELVADGARHLGAQQLGVVAEVAQERVAEDHDPVMEE